MPPPNQNAKYKSVQGLSRGLALLEALNVSARGQSTASELSKLTGLHRTTVRRLLGTLIDSGFIQRSESDDSFRLTRKVRHLSDGFTTFDRLSNIVMPIMGELMQKVVWPSSLCLPDVNAMQICESTHRFSPLSFHRGTTSLRIPFLLTATGRAYFAFCEEEQRNQILDIIQSGDDEQARLARDPVFVDNLVRTVRARGYSTNFGEWEAEKNVGAVAMPIAWGQQTIGSLTIIFLARTPSPEKAIATFVEPLAAAVKKITDLLNQDDNQSGPNTIPRFSLSQDQPSLV